MTKHRCLGLGILLIRGLLNYRNIIEVSSAGTQPPVARGWWGGVKGLWREGR